ncbi:2'-5' RNA ligase family protein [Micromonospora yangpuensis]|uniref:2'-5' RNA ligase n=1 Tax=Micromonospora yangpuensis TaxID=683228 RepID=A0A1C6U101_9ACTN|nr:2'-5' RNA ligase family protein [Micromonospora yangpuensis]GGM11702.1 hypothetical protein GCM10012279_32280 [Micromonospora yangpuensis]SCL47551.1 hypothetical protein GA0070617_0616 [Micromonospora yangpuensis]
MTDLIKVGVSFPVGGSARSTCVRLSDAVAAEVPVQVRLGAAGNSEPHVTVAMGLLPSSRVAAVEEATRSLLTELGGPFDMTFGPAYRETETGRYILLDVVLPDRAANWRSLIQSRLVDIYAEPSRTSATPHLTISCTEQSGAQLDGIINTAPPIPPATVSTIDIARSGPKGIKLEVLKSIHL